MRGQERLVGGDHTLAGSERRPHAVVSGAVGAADQLDENVYTVRAGEADRIRVPGDGGHVEAALTAALASARRRDHDRPSELRREDRPMAFMQAAAGSAAG